MTNFFIFTTSKKVRGPEVKKSAIRTGPGPEKGPISESGYPVLRDLMKIERFYPKHDHISRKNS